MLENWETFSTTLDTDPFLDEAGKFKDDFESTTTDFCDSLDSISNEPISSKASVTSLERIYSYSMDDSDSLDDRATSSSTLNSIYDMNALDGGNDVFAPNLSLFDETPSSLTNFNSTWSPKTLIHETPKPTNSSDSKSHNAALISATSNNSAPKILRISESSNTLLQPILLQSEPKILKMTVVSAATPVQEVIKAAQIGSKKNFKTVKIIKQPQKQQQQQQIPTRIVVIKKPITVATASISSTTTTTYAPFRNASNIISLPTRVYQTKKCFEINNEWESDMPVLTREAPFRPEQLSSTQSSLRRTFFSTTSSSSSSSRILQIFQCPKCQKNLPTKHALAKHLHIHDPPRYKCSQCEKMFYDRTKLRRHQIVHSPKGQYECGICEGKFKSEQNLQIHMISHQNFASLSSFAHVNSQKCIRKLPSILKAASTQ